MCMLHTGIRSGPILKICMYVVGICIVYVGVIILIGCDRKLKVCEENIYT